MPSAPTSTTCSASWVTNAKLATVVDERLRGPPDSPLKQLFFERERAYDLPAADERIVTRLLTEATEPELAADVEAGFPPLCLDHRHVQYAAGVEDVVTTFLTDREDRFTRTLRPADAQARIDERLDTGVEVDRAVWRDLFDASSEVLVPEFEGSKEGAGFALDG